MQDPLGFLNVADWLNPPPFHARDAGRLVIETGRDTDFWRDTYYGFERDSGHFFGAPAPDAFTAVVSFEGAYETLYDQAGLMLRIDARTWLKAGIEHSDGVTNFSAVVTRGRSDWSVVSAPLVSGVQRLRLSRIGGAVLIHHEAAGGWRLMRVADFPEGAARLGIMACSPKRAGFRARFTGFEVGPVAADPLHAV